MKTTVSTGVQPRVKWRKVKARLTKYDFELMDKSYCETGDIVQGEQAVLDGSPQAAIYFSKTVNGFIDRCVAYLGINCELV